MDLYNKLIYLHRLLKELDSSLEGASPATRKELEVTRNNLADEILDTIKLMNKTLKRNL